MGLFKKIFKGVKKVKSYRVEFDPSHFVELDTLQIHGLGLHNFMWRLVRWVT
jgi:hypothetical protein